MALCHHPPPGRPAVDASAGLAHRRRDAEERLADDPGFDRFEVGRSEEQVHILVNDARVAIYLSGRGGAYVTGAVIPVDGGTWAAR